MTPLTPWGSKIRFFLGSRVLDICVNQYCLTFGRVSEKLNGWIKSYGAKIAILVILGVFLTPLAPWDSKIGFFPRVKSNIITTRFNVLESFRKIKRTDQQLWGKNCNFGHFEGIFDPFDPWGSKTRIFPGSRVVD